MPFGNMWYTLVILPGVSLNVSKLKDYYYEETEQNYIRTWYSMLNQTGSPEHSPFCVSAALLIAREGERATESGGGW